MKKAPKLSIQKIAELTKTPSFWESFRYTHGSYTAAAKKMKLAPSILRALGKERTAFEARPVVSDAMLTKLQKALKRVDARDVKTAHEFMYFPGMEGRGASAHFTPGQIAYAKTYTARGKKEQAYFRRAVHEYYTNKTENVRIGFITEKGKVYGNFDYPRKKTEVVTGPRSKAQKAKDRAKLKADKIKTQKLIEKMRRKLARKLEKERKKKRDLFVKRYERERRKRAIRRSRR